MKKLNRSVEGSILLMYWNSRDLGWTIEDCVRAYLYSYKMRKGDWSKRMIGSLVDTFAGKLDIDDGKKRLGFLLHAFWRAWERDVPVVFPLNEKEWKAESGFNISKTFALKDFLKPMVEKDYLEVVKGDSYNICYKFGEKPAELASFEARVRPSPLLRQIFENHRASCLDVEGQFVVWDADLHPVIVRKPSGNGMVKIAASNREAKRMRREVNSINNSNLRHKANLSEEGVSILLDQIKGHQEETVDAIAAEIKTSLLRFQSSLTPVNPENLEYVCVYITNPFGYSQLENIQHLCGFAEFTGVQNENSEMSQNLMPYFTYSRIFTERKCKGRGGSNKFFDLGGRLYSRGSNIPSKSLPLRQHLLIDGEETVELDWSSLHFAIAAHESGVILNQDPYWCDDIIWQGLFVNRSVAKECLSALINCKSRSSAASKCKEYNIRLKTIEGQLKNRGLGWIINFIGTDSGLKFQKIDSDMAVKVMQRFQAITKDAILGYHDSFIVKARHEQALIQVMNEVAIETTGSKITIK